MRYLMFLVLAGLSFGALEEAGSEADPYQIASIADWNEYAAAANQATYCADGKWALLTADLDFNGTEIDIVDVLSGQFRGGNHTISNCRITTTYVSVGRALTGLFGNLAATGDISDLILDDITVIGTTGATGTTYTACFVGELTGGATLDNCHAINADVQLTHTTADQTANLGGLVGACHGDVSFCSFQGRVRGDTTGADTATAGAPALYIGSIVGHKAAYATATTGIDDCVAYAQLGHLSGASTAAVYIGGISGDIQDGAGNTIDYITDSRFYGTINYISAGQLYAGGITAYMQAASGGAIDDSFCEGSITVKTAGICDVGGAVGYVSGGTIDRCSANMAISIYANTAVDHNIGNFIGYARDTLPAGSTSIVIQDCYGKGSIYDAIEGSTVLNLRYGGFIGIAYAGTNFDITRCYANVSGYSDKAGGEAYVAGFAGRDVGTVTYLDCFWNDDNTPDDDLGNDAGDDAEVIGKTTTQMQTQATFTTDSAFDFTVTPVWKFYEGDTPYLNGFDKAEQAMSEYIWNPNTATGSGGYRSRYR